MNENKRLFAIYFGGLLLAMHYALVVYVNSSLLKLFVSDGQISALYAFASFISILSLIFAPKLLSKFGSVPILCSFILLEIIAVLGLGSVNLGLLIVGFFILHHAAEFIIAFSMDITLESETMLENTTGRKRGSYLTIQNIAWIASPLLVSFLISTGADTATPASFSNVYFLSGAVLAILFFVILIFFRDINPSSSKSDFVNSLRKLGKNDSTRIFLVQLSLNFYYAWMVIYLPLLLAKDIGFAWHNIALMFTIMLLPFLLFELPIGFLADKKFGEKEVMFLGFIFLSVFTFAIPFIHSANFFIWAAILFMTRVGASMIEISAETYFFKHVTATDSGQISLFRIARPLSFILSMIFAVPVLYFTSYGGSFFFLALFSLLGLLFIPKVDTR